MLAAAGPQEKKKACGLFVSVSLALCSLHKATSTITAGLEEALLSQLPSLFLRFSDTLWPHPHLLVLQYIPLLSGRKGTKEKKTAGFLLQLLVDVLLNSGFITLAVPLKCTVLIDQKSLYSDILICDLFYNLCRKSSVLFLFFNLSQNRIHSNQLIHLMYLNYRWQESLMKRILFPSVACVLVL